MYSIYTIDSAIRELSKMKNPSMRKTRTALFSAFIATFFIAPVALADDIEVFNVPDNKPKVLFLLDYSQSMKNSVGNSPLSKLEILKQTMSTVIDNSKGSVELGLGPMFAMSSGGIQWPISDLNADAHTIDSRIPAGQKKAYEVMTDIINDTNYEFGTATVPALVEAARYFQGGKVEIGGADQNNTLRFKPSQWNANSERFDNFDIWSANPAAYSPEDAYSVGTAPGSTGQCKQYRRSEGARFCEDFSTRNCSSESDVLNYNLCEYQHSDEWRGANYNSPIESSCQANYIVLVSDGRPYNAGHFDAMEDMLGHPFDGCEDLSQSVFGSNRFEGNCGPEIAEYMFKNDMRADVPDSNVITHTVGFDLGETGSDYLDRVAMAGRGKSYSANTPEELVDSLTSILNDTVSDLGQFSNFSVDVNRATFSHDHRAYIPLFKPSASTTWAGNLKGFFLGPEGLKDVNGNVARKEGVEGFEFAVDSQSFWSQSPDGNDVTEGGASNVLVADQRKLITYTGDTNSVPAGGVSLSAAQYELDSSNTQITPADLGVSGSTSDLLDWIRAQPMGAPLHSNAVTADYSNNKRVVFTMTNQGFLHAVDATYPVNPGDLQGGSEIFAFMPKELLPNIDYMMNGGFTGEHLYGLDGQITRWHTDNNNDGIVNGSDELLIVFGMRRGGNHYYALDVTDPRNPRFKWQITGGAGAFAKLNQTWSKASLVTVKSGNATERVLMFGGGYDDSLDDLQAARPSTGNSIFMVDNDGDLIWSASHPAMRYAIASDITVIDSDSDGLADRAYVGDLGSQVWRIDFDDIRDSSDFVVSHFADLSGQGYRPLFYKPSVSRESATGSLMIALGAGNRDNPISDQARGALFMLIDSKTEALDAGSAKLVPLTYNELYDVTNEPQVPVSEQTANQGWFVQLEPGEKALSAPLTLEGRLLATTFLPAAPHSGGVCDPVETIGRLYSLGSRDANTENGQTEVDTPTSENPSEWRRTHRYSELPGSGIPPGPTVVFAQGSEELQIYVGNDAQIDIDPTLGRVYWHSK